MEINDKMVDAAFEMFASKTIWNRNAMRAALEAALGVKSENASKFVKELKDSAYWQSNEDYAKAAACIEDLAGTLKPFSDLGMGHSMEIYEMSLHARATLERWGLK